MQTVTEPPGAVRDEVPAEVGGPLFGTGFHFKAGWNRHDAAITQVSLLQVIRQLPGQIAVCLRLAWDADPRAALTVLVCQTATGIATAFGLLAANGVC